MKPKYIRILGIIGAIILIVWWKHNRSAEVQAPLTFTRIVNAIKDGNADALLAQLHPDYDFKANWPEEWNEIGGAYNPRLIARQALQEFFKSYENDPLGCSTTIESIDAHDDVVDAVVTLHFVSRSGGSRFSDQVPITHHKFVLAHDGWTSAKLFIKGHEPIRRYE